MKAILPFLFLSAGSLTASAASDLLCAASIQEFADLKSKLPAKVNELPIRLGHEVSTPEHPAIVWVDIANQNNAMLMSSQILYKGVAYKDTQEIKKICINGKTEDLRLVMANGVVIKMDQANSEYSVSGVKLKVLDKEQSAKINAHINAAPVPVSSGGVSQ